MLMIEHFGWVYMWYYDDKMILQFCELTHRDQPVMHSHNKSLTAIRDDLHPQATVLYDTGDE